MRVFNTHFRFFIIWIVSSILFLLASLFISFRDQSFRFRISLFRLWNIDINIRVFLDFYSLWFSTIILIISSLVMVYSYNYMSPYRKAGYFLWLTNLFIISMLIVVLFSDLFFVMLGWDGLGLISFFLIAFYQNQSSITRGVFTLLINRIGDSLFLVSIALFSIHSDSLYSLSTFIPQDMCLFILILAFMTKRALYPFSPWLPAAIAAPTPISALVHSSTLVTAGLYLIIRFSYFLYSSYFCIVVLLVLSIFTSLYAGINTIFETDLKKLIALSTLSHLGFIAFSFSLGLIHLCFFHILTHALFKSLLFMCIGDIMINLSHSQDLRFLSKGSLFTPVSSFIIYVSIFNLLGLPFLSGFFSKDIILELVGYSSIVSGFLYLLTFINVFLTYYYSYKLFFYSFSSVKLTPFFSIHQTTLIHCILICFLSLIRIVFGKFFLSHVYRRMLFVIVPTTLKYIPVLLNLILFSFLVLFLSLHYPSDSKLLFTCCSGILFLTQMISSISRSSYYFYLFNFTKSSELGFLNFTLNTSTDLLRVRLSTIILHLSQLNLFKVVLFSFISLFLVLVLV